MFFDGVEWGVVLSINCFARQRLTARVYEKRTTSGGEDDFRLQIRLKALKKQHLLSNLKYLDNSYLEFS